MIWLPVLTMLDPSFASASPYGGSDEHLDFAFSLRLIGELSELGVTLFAREELFYLAADLREWRGAGRPAFVDLDDVKAEGGFDDAADGARLEGESSGFERRFHLTFGEESEVATFRGAARIVRFLGRQLREVAATHLFEHLLRFRAGLLLGGRVGTGRQADHDVARVHHFVLLEALEVLFVEGVDIRVLNRNLRLDFGIDQP